MTEIVNMEGKQVAVYRSPLAQAVVDFGDALRFGESTISVMRTADQVNRRIDRRRRGFYERRARRNDRFFAVIMAFGFIVAACAALLPIIWVSMR